MANTTIYPYGVGGSVPTPTQKAEGRLVVSYGVNKDTTTGGLGSATSNYYVTTQSIVAFPSQGLTVGVKLPGDMYCQFFSGGYNIGTASAQLENGDSCLFPSSHLFYRIKFWKKDGSTLAASEVDEMVAAGEIDFTYITDDADVVARNADRQAQVDALRRKLVATMADNGMDTLPVFVHLSDLHGDAPRLRNALEYCGKIGGVDGVLATGDFVMYQGSNYNDFQLYLAKQHNFPYFFCIGNHEATTNDVNALFADNIQGLAAQYGYLEAASTPATKCYYYKDLDAKKIRIIALNYYNLGTASASLGQAQLDWFVARLLDTPAGYGIIVLMHSPEGPMQVGEDHAKFYQYRQMSNFANDGVCVGDRPIMHIVDAFISRSTYSASFADNGVTVSINADFSSVDEATEFICYANGHRHRDFIGYLTPAVNLQLDLNITASTSLYGVEYAAFANEEDLPRGSYGVRQDSFNLYAIDREAGVVKVVRIGANQNEDLKMRDYMTIPYKAI